MTNINVLWHILMIHGQTLPWVVPLGTSHFDFLKLIELNLKNHRKHLNKYLGISMVKYTN
jgi:hypothetical protein